MVDGCEAEEDGERRRSKRWMMIKRTRIGHLDAIIAQGDCGIECGFTCSFIDKYIDTYIHKLMY